jgi:hypothetical protein
MRIGGGSMSALYGGQPAPRSGNLWLRVRDEQRVSPLYWKPAETRMGFEWTAPTSRRPILANRDGRESATELRKSVRSFLFETKGIDRRARAAPRRQAEAKNRVSKHG